ncbi:MAG: hypothetical protein ABIH69_07590 [bacterium]
MLKKIKFVISFLLLSSILILILAMNGCEKVVRTSSVASLPFSLAGIGLGESEKKVEELLGYVVSSEVSSDVNGRTEYYYSTNEDIELFFGERFIDNNSARFVVKIIIFGDNDSRTSKNVGIGDTIQNVIEQSGVSYYKDTYRTKERYWFRDDQVVFMPDKNDYIVQEIAIYDLLYI